MNADLDGKVIEFRENDKEVVINRGTDHGVEDGMIYLIYLEGEEIVDPDTKESLGKLEIVCGRGKVTHTQAKMSTLCCIEIEQPVTRITRPRRSGWWEQFGSVTEERTVKTLPFKKVGLGALARFLKK